jgi:hypothetical protein
MTEIHCPACSALLNLSLAVSGAESHQFAQVQQPVIKSKARKESERLAGFNGDLVSALREFLAVHPWAGHRLPGEIQEDFLTWCRLSPDDRRLMRFVTPFPITKNRISKLLVSEIGATFIKGSKGREYRLPEALQPAGADGAPPVDNGAGPAAGVDLGGEGSLGLTGVASLPLAEHVAAVRAQAAAEDDWAPSYSNYIIPTRAEAAAAAAVEDGISDPMQEVVVEEPDYSLPEHLVLDGPSVFPVEAGAAPAEPSGSWWVYLTDAEADYEPEALEQVALGRLPDRLVLTGVPLLRFDQDGAPYLQCPVHSTDGVPAGTGEVRVPLPWADQLDAADVGVTWPPDTAGDAVERAAEAPLPSVEQLAAVAGHEALERARAAAQPAAPVFLASRDYEGVDPGDWG